MSLGDLEHVASSPRPASNTSSEESQPEPQPAPAAAAAAADDHEEYVPALVGDGEAEEDAALAEEEEDPSAMYRCERCDIDFMDVIALKVHYRKPGGQHNICIDCARDFTTQGEYMDHVSSCTLSAVRYPDATDTGLSRTKRARGTLRNLGL